VTEAARSAYIAITRTITGASRTMQRQPSEWLNGDGQRGNDHDG
jgi:hypothetical protein